MLKIPTNLPKAPKQVFALATPRHMFMKLCWEKRQFEEKLKPNQSQLSRHLEAAYCAFNFAVTSWHLTDWVWKSLSDEEKVEVASMLKMEKPEFVFFKKYVRGASKAVEVCRQIANGSKHMKEITDPSEPVEVTLDWNVKRAVVGQFSAGQPLAEYTHELTVLVGEEQVAASVIFQEAVNFWRRFLPEFGFLDPEFVWPENGPFEDQQF